MHFDIASNSAGQRVEIKFLGIVPIFVEARCPGPSSAVLILKPGDVGGIAHLFTVWRSDLELSGHADVRVGIGSLSKVVLIYWPPHIAVDHSHGELISTLVRS